MEPAPSAQIVGQEFVKQYYTMLNAAPEHLHRLIPAAVYYQLYYYKSCLDLHSLCSFFRLIYLFVFVFMIVNSWPITSTVDCTAANMTSKFTWCYVYDLLSMLTSDTFCLKLSKLLNYFSVVLTRVVPDKFQKSSKTVVSVCLSVSNWLHFWHLIKWELQYFFSYCCQLPENITYLYQVL